MISVVQPEYVHHDWHWWMLAVALVFPIPAVWLMYWVTLLKGSILKDLFGDTYLKSWYAGDYQDFKRWKPWQVWLLGLGGTVFAVLLWAALYVW